MNMSLINDINIPGWEDIYKIIIDYLKNIDGHKLNKQILVLSGEPGSGKTTLAKQLESILKSKNILKDEKIICSYLNNFDSYLVNDDLIKEILEQADGKMFLLSDIFLTNSDENKELFKQIIEEFNSTQSNFLPIFEIYPSEKNEILEQLKKINNSYDITLIEFPDENSKSLLAKFLSLLRRQNFDIAPNLIEVNNETNLSNLESLFNKLFINIQNKDSLITSLSDYVINKHKLSNNDYPYISRQDFYGFSFENIFLDSSWFDNKTAKERFNTYLKDYIEDNYISELELERLLNIQLDLEIYGKKAIGGLILIVGHSESYRKSFITLLDHLLYYYKTIKSPVPLIVTYEDFLKYSSREISNSIKDYLDKGNMVVLKDPYKIFTSNLFSEEMQSFIYDTYYSGKGKICFEGTKEEIEDFIKIDPSIYRRISIKVQLVDITQDDLYRMFEERLKIDLDTQTRDIIKSIIKSYQNDSISNLDDGTFIEELTNDIYLNYLDRKGEDYNIISKVQPIDIPLDKVFKILNINIPTLDLDYLEKLILLKNIIDNQIKNITNEIDVFELKKDNRLESDIIIQTEMPNFGNIFLENLIKKSMSKVKINDLIGAYTGQTGVITQKFLEDSKGNTILIDINGLEISPYYQDVISVIEDFIRQDHSDTNLIIIGNKNAITNLKRLNEKLLKYFTYLK